jgi:hypothetical protein
MDFGLALSAPRNDGERCRSSPRTCLVPDTGRIWHRRPLFRARVEGTGPACSRKILKVAQDKG